MTEGMWGANVEALEALGTRFRQAADRIEAMHAQVRTVVNSVPWGGTDVTQFRGRWDQHDRALMSSAVRGLRDAADTVMRNAAAQRSTSAADGRGSSVLRSHPIRTPYFPSRPFPGPPWARIPEERFFPWPGRWHSTFPPDFPTFLRPCVEPRYRYPDFPDVGNWLRRIDEHGTPFFALAGMVGGSIGSGVSSGFSAITSGWTAGEHLGEGKYVDAGLDVIGAGGDITAFALKKGGGPVGYGAGVAVQTWTEVLRAGREVDWSENGLSAIREASLGDWAGAFGEALTKMPNRIVKIFGW